MTGPLFVDVHSVVFIEGEKCLTFSVCKTYLKGKNYKNGCNVFASWMKMYGIMDLISQVQTFLIDTDLFYLFKFPP